MDTARLIGGIEPMVEHRLIEMDWGDWEGCSLPELRERLGRSMQENESRGLDFTTPAGDSPRAVMSRFIDWAGAVARLGESVVAVTHKGVIRAALAYAIGWNMEHKAPVKLDWDRIHGFEIDREGQFTLVLPNVALDARPQGGSERER
jgi:probable phosphoglycerate mutase